MQFKRTEKNDVKNFYEYFLYSQDRIVDFSTLGAAMWHDYFKQEFLIEDDILYLKYEIYNGETAFNVPLCNCSKKVQAYERLAEYCKEHNIPLVFKEVTLETLNEISHYFPFYETQTDNDWAEYIYDIRKLASLSGKKLNKKRNHYNKFMKLYSNDVRVEQINDTNIADVIQFHNKFSTQNNDNEMESYENDRALKVLERIKDLPHSETLVVYIKDKVVAYTVGEVIDGMLYVHIEKADVAFDGVYNYINKIFAEKMLEKYPSLILVNRADDAGDLGLRQAKLTYNPLTLINKFIVRIRL